MKKKRSKLPPHLHKLVDHLQEIFEIRNWDKHISFPVEDKEHVAASIDTEEDYQRIHITIYPLFFRESRQQQREYILHEFCHMVTHGLVHLLDEFKRGNLVTPQQVKFECERATSRMALIMDAFFCKRFNKEIRGYTDYLKLPKRSKTKLAKSKAK